MTVERLTNRLASIPLIFRAKVGSLRVDAIVADLVRARGTRMLERAEIDRVGQLAARHLELVLIASWLLHDETFAGMPTDALLGLLDARLGRLAAAVMPRLFVEDAERREELVRTCLAELGRVPDGESPLAAQDRLDVLDSVRRRDLLRDARARETAREAARKQRKAELDRLRAQEEEAARQAARTTHED